MISIVIPVFNAERFLRYTLESLVAQTFHEWEAICVDDCSSDGSDRILDQFARQDSRFHVKHLAKNVGPDGARNIAVSLARGEWITFVDADDMLAEKWLEMAVSVIVRENPDVVRQSYFYGVNPPKNFFKRRGPVTTTIYKGMEATKWAWETFFPKGFLWATFFRREIIDGLQFKPRMRCKEDSIWMIEAVPKIKKICYNDFEGYFYRAVPESVSRRKRQYSQCVAYLEALYCIWNQQRELAASIGAELILKKCIRHSAENDVIEWIRMSDTPLGNSDVRRAYLSLFRACRWSAIKSRSGSFFIPLACWRMTGSRKAFSAVMVLWKLKALLRKVI